MRASRTFDFPDPLGPIILVKLRKGPVNVSYSKIMNLFILKDLKFLIIKLSSLASLGRLRSSGGMSPVSIWDMTKSWELNIRVLSSLSSLYSNKNMINKPYEVILICF